MLSIGGDVLSRLREAIGTVKYDDAPVVARLRKNNIDGGTFHTIQRVYYNPNENVLVIEIGGEGLSYEALRQGWRPE